LTSTPVSYDSIKGPNPGELARLLLNHTDYLAQVERLNSFLTRLGFSKLVLKTAQLAHFDDVAVPLQGTGLRSLFTILCALTDPGLSAIIIDEPELSIEPTLQRELRDLLIEEAGDRTILVATHSHLFLNPANLTSNYLIRSEGEIVSVSSVGSIELMHDLVFRLLGNSTTDLFFPGNYLVVEGASDQIVSERVLHLLQHPPGRVKVLSAQGVGRVKRVIQSVLDALIPLMVNDSPYARTVVALVDSPASADSEKVEDLKKRLEDRLFVLPEPSLEEYLPAALFEKAGRDKNQDIEEINRLKKTGDFAEIGRFKRAISEQVASMLDVEDLPAIEILQNAVARAVELAIQREAYEGPTDRS
jgi:predicted ATP-dependent endonuclease of OLD family